jgi:hypothetical protein
MDKEQALNNFWNSFGIPAYDENSVPDEAALPYITYSVGIDEFNRPVSLSASIWYRTTSWVEITNKQNQISETIGLGGVMIPYNTGSIWIKKGSPFSQRISSEDNSIRRIFMNIEAEFIN